MKSAERVRDLGEVFTPPEIVDAMLDLLPGEVWQVHPSSTFFEPAAGDGNFLVEILARKLHEVHVAHKEGRLPAGDDVAALEFHALQALSSIYAVDISEENIVGGTPGHEVGARDRLLMAFKQWFEQVTDQRLHSRSMLLSSARWIVERNVLIANMLEHNADGSPSGRDQLPLVEYRWDPSEGVVELVTTTLGQVQRAARVRAGGAQTLFDALEQPKVRWRGAARYLRDAPVDAPSPLTGPTRNGKRVR